MRSSLISALCAVSLVSAGYLQQNLVGRELLAPEITERSSELAVREITIVQAKSEDIIIIWVNNGGGAATQTLVETKTVTQAAGPATHTVTVGGSAGTVYSPESISAAVGDMVIFNFEAKNHTVTQSAFATPCEKLADGMDTNFVPNTNGTTPPPAMAIQVMTDAPQWFYCRQTNHCGMGMVFSINPTASKTQAMFKTMAVAQNGTGIQSAIQGGTPSDSGSGTAAASAVSSPAAAAAAAPSVASGMGSTAGDGTCSCSCLCGQAAFPEAAMQGVGMFGGMSGAMPRSLLEK